MNTYAKHVYMATSLVHLEPLSLHLFVFETILVVERMRIAYRTMPVAAYKIKRTGGTVTSECAASDLKPKPLHYVGSDLA